MNEKKTGKYSEEIKVKAKQLFFANWSFHEIAKEIRDETGRKCNASLVKSWSDKGKWEEEKTGIIQKVNNSVAETFENSLVKRAEDQLTAYQKMIDMGLAAIVNDSVMVDKVSEAVELIDKGIRGERMISSGLVSWKYIEQVVQIIIEEVKDDETKRRIANRLRGITEDILTL